MLNIYQVFAKINLTYSLIKAVTLIILNIGELENQAKKSFAMH